MAEHRKKFSSIQVPVFNRSFFDSGERITRIGQGSIGGKAQGLALALSILSEKFDQSSFTDITASIPTLTVIATDYFDQFMLENNLHEIAYSDEPDNRIALAFQQTDLPTELLGDLRALIASAHTPLAIRSSSMLEDAIYEPFAGVYATKMIPNNQPDADTRFRKLVEAIKFVYASTFFSEAKSYIKATKHSIEDEKMAIIIQDVVGLRHDRRFYPNLSGVARSYNFYPTGHAKPEHGVIDLALGLGKTIVDGGKAWSYSPTFPKSVPPYNSINDLLKQTQTEFWAVNMGKPPAYDPTRETEYMFLEDLSAAEFDGTLDYIASTYVSERDRISPGVGVKGPRILNFAPILQLNEFKLNNFIKSLLEVCENTLETPVEIEFAMTFDTRTKEPARFGFLQVRPMVVSKEKIEIAEEELKSENAIVASDRILGNGIIDDISEIVFVKPDKFDAKNSPQIVYEIEAMNKNLVGQNKKYILIGFGRWGSSDPWLGIPVNWAQINGAGVIVESTLPDMNVELSQGSHFFHNITSFRIPYFSVRFDGNYKINWEWLSQQKVIEESENVCHCSVNKRIIIKVDGKSGRGVILA